MKKFLLTLILILVAPAASAQGLTMVLKGEPTFGTVPPIWLALRFADETLAPSSVYPASLPATVFLSNTWDDATLDGQVEFDLKLPGQEFHDEPLIAGCGQFNNLDREMITRDTVIGTDEAGDTFHLNGCTNPLDLDFASGRDRLVVNIKWPVDTQNDPNFGYALVDLDQIPLVPAMQEPTGQFNSDIQLSRTGGGSIRWEVSEVRVYVPEPSFAGMLLPGIAILLMFAGGARADEPVEIPVEHEEALKQALGCVESEPSSSRTEVCLEGVLEDLRDTLDTPEEN